jgi:hypothetical protein
MKKGCLIALGIPVGLALLVVALFWLNFYDIHVRYRLTVEVQDGDQIKSGSSVIDASYTVEPDWSPSGPHVHDPGVVGYAPTVDLGEKGMLFLTFDKTRTPFYERERRKQVPCGFGVIGCLPFAAYNKSGVWNNSSEMKAVLYELLRQSGPRDVPFAILPKLARFRDINAPLSLTPVSPNDLAASFGPGVQLKRVILELTDDPVRSMPAIWPQWLTKKGDTYDYNGILFHVPKR